MQAGDADRLLEAIEDFRAAVRDFEDADARSDVARNQNALGNALQTLGARERGTERRGRSTRFVMPRAQCGQSDTARTRSITKLASQKRKPFSRR